MDAPPAPLVLDDFAPLVGQSFRDVEAPDAPPFALTSAKGMKTFDYPGRQRDAFALTFESDAPQAEQGVRLFDLPGLGPTGIFLVPVDRRGATMVYEAVFN